jgi:hypothetical protein
MNSRHIIDQLFESPYYRLKQPNPYFTASTWAEQNKIDVVGMDKLRTIEVEYPSLPDLIRDIKFTTCKPEDFETSEAFVALKEPGEEAVYLNHLIDGQLNTKLLVLLKPGDEEKLMRRHIEGCRFRVAKNIEGH